MKESDDEKHNSIIFDLSNDIEEEEHNGEKSPLLNSFNGSHKIPKAAQSYESLNFDSIENDLYKKEVRALTKTYFRYITVIQWTVTFIIGFVTGIIAFGIDMGVTALSDVKFDLSTDAFNSNYSYGLLAFIGISVGLVAVATVMVSFLEKVAAGSGIPEIKCYLNGVKVPRVVRLKTLFCKAVGVLFSVSGGLAVGKEGPMIHSGAAVAAGLSQGKSSSLKWLNTKFLKYFRNDQAKRDFVSGGAAAGVAAAFGAPIGGVLFSLEEGASFWNQQLTWRTLFCSMTSTFTLNFFLSGTTEGGTWGELTEPGLINFGSFNDQENPGYNIIQIPLFLLMGVIGGLLGALFNYLNEHLTVFRMKFVQNAGWKMMLESLFVALVTALVCYNLSMSPWFTTCVKIAANDTLTSYQYECEDGYFNDMSSILFASQEDGIKHLFHAESKYSNETLILAFLAYFTLSCWTYGIAVPSGLFVPCLLTGCAYGRLIGQICESILPDEAQINPGTFALIGAASMLGGVVRMTISLTVILMESTNDITYGLPIMLTLMLAKWVGDVFNEGLYDIHIELREIPLLEWDPPIAMRKFCAKDIMKNSVKCLSPTSKVSKVVDLLQTTKHNGYPVVEEDGTFLGLILRSQLITLLNKKVFKQAPNQDQSFYLKVTRDDFLQDYPRYPDIQEIELLDIHNDYYLDLSPYMNPVPYTINENAPLPRVFRLFRTMGIRHLVITDITNKVVGIVTRKDLTHLDHKVKYLHKQYAPTIIVDESEDSDSDFNDEEFIDNLIN
eukprot:TRINITY_DN13635_c0_g1_i1.p1 TRINITY_DN13635_c0_g1~~TRINITY_DN13635_c0_g1_i1.p1  ORF type:complete len:779 (+),score=262.03 TRINITY_DN13635_c0_g1_i1:24-2360(+)